MERRGAAEDGSKQQSSGYMEMTLVASANIKETGGGWERVKQQATLQTETTAVASANSRETDDGRFKQQDKLRGQRWLKQAAVSRAVAEEGQHMLATRQSERTAVATANNRETGGGWRRATHVSNRKIGEDSGGENKQQRDVVSQTSRKATTNQS